MFAKKVGFCSMCSEVITSTTYHHYFDLPLTSLSCSGDKGIKYIRVFVVRQNKKCTCVGQEQKNGVKEHNNWREKVGNI